MSQHLEEETHLDRSEVVPVHVRKGNGAAGELEHLIDGAGAKGPLGAPWQVPSVRHLPQLEVREPGTSCRHRAEAMLQEKHQHAGAERARHGYGGVGAVRKQSRLCLGESSHGGLAVKPEGGHRVVPEVDAGEPSVGGEGPLEHVLGSRRQCSAVRHVPVPH